MGLDLRTNGSVRNDERGSFELVCKALPSPPFSAEGRLRISVEGNYSSEGSVSRLCLPRALRTNVEVLLLRVSQVVDELAESLAPVLSSRMGRELAPADVWKHTSVHQLVWGAENEECEVDPDRCQLELHIRDEDGEVDLVVASFSHGQLVDWDII